MMRLFDSYPFGLILAVLLFSSNYKKKRYFLPKILLISVTAIVVYDIGVHCMNPLPVAWLDRMLMILPVIYVIFGVWICFECKILDAVYNTITAHVVQTLVFNVYSLLKVKLDLQEGSVLSVGITLLLTVVIYSSLYFIFKRNFKGNQIIQYNQWKLIGSALFILIWTTYFMPRVSNVDQQYQIYIGYIFADIFAIMIQFGIFYESDLERKTAIMEQLLYAEQKKQQVTKENIALINRKCHDLKHQISALRTMEPSEKREEYINEIENAVLIYGSAVQTGNQTLNLILMDKMLFCEQHEIKFTCVTDGEKLGFMDTMDIYSMFGNAMDNAIEATCKEEPEKRIINLRVGSNENFLVVHIENYVSKQLVLVDEIPLTTKVNKDYHGFGIMSIRYIAQKYGGTMNIKVDNNLFCLDILLPLKERKQKWPYSV
nr:sensor histidine kinase [uncultured Blautia sp.]